MIPGVYIRDLVELTRRWKVEPDALLAGLPVRYEELSEPSTRVAIDVCAQIVERALAMTGEPALAFHLGTQMRLSSHGFLGFAAMTASTVRAALALATTYAATRTSAIGLSLYVERDTASLVIEERVPLAGFRPFAMIGLIVGLWQLGRALTGKMLDGRVECGFPEPPYFAKSPLADRLQFDRPVTRLVFAASVLDLPLVSADPVATQLARAQCERELAAVVDGSLPSRVRAAIAAKPDGVPALPEVAKAVRLSTRTMKRKLAEQGTTFSALLDEARRNRAMLLLDDRTLSIGEVATKVGYSELPNFTRAFRKWTGTTPAAYRARKQ